jgi:DNA-binding SARP family transcriptional activator/TolB-like protein
MTEARQSDSHHAGRRAGRAYVVRWWGKFGLVDADSGADALPRGRRAQAILAMLSSRPGVPILRTDLAAMFWGDRGDEQARASVRQSLAELRNLGAGIEPMLVIDLASVTLVPDLVGTRTAELEELIATGDAAALQRILERGDGFLAGLDGISGPFDDWLRTERSQALEALIRAAIQVTTSAIARGEALAAQRLANRVQAIDPLDERLAQAGFEADAAASDAVALERRFRAIEQRLKEDLGVPPSKATVDAYAEASAKLRVASTPAAPARARRFPSRFTRPQLLAAAVVGLFLAAVVAALATGLGGSGASASPHTIAVIPFTAADEQQPLAEGVAEEIVSRLSRNPKVAPLGRNSARVIGGDPSGAIALGRELRVDYLLTGKLVAGDDRLSIDAELVRTRDGQSVWSSNYAGSTRELVPLMNRMAGDVSREIGAGVLPQPRRHVPRDGADQLYYRAKSLLGGGEPEHVSTAVELLREAIRLDPEYASAWSLLGMAARHQQLQHLVPEGDPNDVLIPQAYARRGLELAPDSAEANLAMGDTLAEDPRSLPYVLRAAQLDPVDAEIWMELAEKYEKAGDFIRVKEVLDRAASIDPLSQKIVLNAATWNRSIGEPRTALQQVQQLYRHGQPRARVQHMLRGNLAFTLGDFSRAYQEFVAASASADPASRTWADGGRGSVLYAIGLPQEARPYIPFKAIEADWDLFVGEQPSAATIDISRKHPFYAWNMQERNYLLLRLLVNHGRFAEVAALYDRRFKSPDEFSRTPRGHMAFIGDSIPVVLALRKTGRTREADQIHAIARGQVEARLRAGKVPGQYLFLAAQLHAIGDDPAGALALLGRAAELGWLNRANLALPDIADEPAFRSLRSNPRFRELRDGMEARYARERAEVLAARARTTSS